MNDKETEKRYKPLITDSALSRFVIGSIATLLTLALGWAAQTLKEIATETTKTAEDLEIFESHQNQFNERLNRISTRVDKLYEIELKQSLDGK